MSVGLSRQRLDRVWIVNTRPSCLPSHREDQTRSVLDCLVCPKTEFVTMVLLVDLGGSGVVAKPMKPAVGISIPEFCAADAGCL